MAAANPAFRDSDVAVIGIAGEFPAAPDLDRLWRLLLPGGVVITSLPTDRWPAEDSTGYCRHAGVMDDAYRFDPGFFSIAPIQALHTDPQERRLLQTAYHALENSGYFDQPHGDVGVYTAAMYSLYQQLGGAGPAFSTSFAQIANRISHGLNLRGPSLCVDTMCSGSLVALHLAVSALRNGECRLAVVGAANIHVRAGKFRLLCEGGYLSRSGRCHSFGAAADGYVAGEGSIAVVLKGLADARESGDRIWGVIRATAVGSEGGGRPFTVPGVAAQADVIQRAIRISGLTAGQINYVECHGTGTPVGDPVEIASVGRGYGDSARVSPLPIGSIKGNIGHLEAAAGLAGLVKVLLQMRHGVLLPSVGCSPINPKLELAAKNLAMSVVARRWEEPRIAGINAFGAGGTNVHVIVQAPPSTPAQPPLLRPLQPLIPAPVSAHSLESLRSRIGQLLAWCDQHLAEDICAVGATLACTREHHRYRVCPLVSDIASLRRALAETNEADFCDVRRPADADGSAQRSAAMDPGSAVDSAHWAASYLRGAAPAWRDIFPVARWVELPAYPFGGRNFDAMRASAHGLAQAPAPMDSSSRATFVGKPAPASALRWNHLQGDGPTVLLLSPTNLPARIWHCQTEFFRRRNYNILVPVYPGHEGNGMPSGPIDLPDMAEAVARHLDACGTGPVHCVGWSLGAALAMHLALSHAEHLRSMALIAGAARFEGSMSDILASFQIELRQWMEFVGLQLDVRGAASGGPGGFTAGANNETMTKYYDLLRAHDLRARLPQIRTRTLVLHGEVDRCVGDREFSALAAIPGANAVTVPGVGHLLPVTAPFAVNRRLLDHMS